MEAVVVRKTVFMFARYIDVVEINASMKEEQKIPDQLGSTSGL